MKKFFRGGLVAALLLSGVTAAQAQISFGPKVGLNLSNFSYKVPSGMDKPSTSMAVGASFGLMLNARFGNIAIQPAVTYSMKGAKYKESASATLDSLGTTATSLDVTTHLGYVEIPINVVYTTGGDKGFQVFAGPYIGFGIGGKTKGTAKATTPFGSVSTDVNETVKFGSGDDADFKTVDFGLNVGVGYLVNNFQVQAGYGLGLSNIVDSGSDDYKVRNSNIHLTVGYLFGAN